MPSLPLELLLFWDSSKRNTWAASCLMLKQLRLWWHQFTWWQQTRKLWNSFRWVKYTANYHSIRLSCLWEEQRRGTIMFVALLQDLTTKNKIMQNPVLHRIVLLGYGTMVSKYCAAHKYCPPDIVMVLRPSILLRKLKVFCTFHSRVSKRSFKFLFSANSRSISVWKKLSTAGKSRRSPCISKFWVTPAILQASSRSRRLCPSTALEPCRCPWGSMLMPSWP